MNSNEILQAFRETDAEIDAEWPAPVRDAMRDRILESSRDAVGDEPARTRWVSRHRRWVAVGSVAACLALVGGVVGLALPSGAPGAPDAAAAATIEHLAVVAGEQGGIVRPGQYSYGEVTDAQPPQKNGLAMPGSTLVDGFEQTTRREWFAPDGTTWRYRGLGASSCLRKRPMNERERQLDAANPRTPVGGVYYGLTSAALATLPTDPVELAAFFDAHSVDGTLGASHRFEAVNDLVRSGLAQPALRAASIRVLADTPGIVVHTGVRDPAGREATQIAYTTRERVYSRIIPRYKTGTESLYFDPSTSRLLAEQSTFGGKVGFRSIVTELKTVDSVPTDLPLCPYVPEG